MRIRRQAAATRIMYCAAAMIVVAVMAFTAAPTAAGFSKAVEKACLADYKKLCPQYKIDSLQLRACMEWKSSSISWGCIEALIDSGEVDRKRTLRR